MPMTAAGWSRRTSRTTGAGAPSNGTNTTFPAIAAESSGPSAVGVPVTRRAAPVVAPDGGLPPNSCRSVPSLQVAVTAPLKDTTELSATSWTRSIE